MTVYNGNVVRYGSGGSWYVQLEVWDSGTTTGDTVQVWYTYRIVTTHSMSDSSNSVVWSDPWGGGSASANIQHGASGGVTVFPGANPNVAAAKIRYGASNYLAFRISVTGLGTGGTGPSTIDISYPLPWRTASTPKPPSVYASNVTATSALVRSVNNGDGGSPINQVHYRLNRADGSTHGDLYGGWAGVSFVNLSRGSTYTAFARVRNEAGSWSGWSGPHVFATPSNLPGAPGTPTTEVIARTQAVAIWTAPANDGGSPKLGYHLQADDSSTFSSPAVDATGPANLLSMTMRGLLANTTYYVRVRTWTSKGYSSWSGVHTFKTGPAVPAAPKGVAISGITGGSALVSWAAAATNGTPVTGYRVQVHDGLDFAPPQFSVDLPASARSHLFTGLAPNETYYVRVFAKSAIQQDVGNGEGSSLWSAPVSFRTRAALWIRANNAWREGQLFIFIDGAWRSADIYVTLGTPHTWIYPSGTLYLGGDVFPYDEEE